MATPTSDTEQVLLTAARRITDLPLVIGLVYLIDDLGRYWQRPTTADERRQWLRLVHELNNRNTNPEGATHHDAAV